MEKDTCRVIILKLCTEINKLLVSGCLDPRRYLEALLSIYSAIGMLEKSDDHRHQAHSQLSFTLKCSSHLFQQMCILEDVNIILSAIQ